MLSRLSGKESRASPPYIWMARPHCLQLLAHRDLSACDFGLARAGRSMLARIATIRDDHQKLDQGKAARWNFEAAFIVRFRCEHVIALGFGSFHNSSSEKWRRCSKY